LLSCSDDGTVRLYDFSPLSRVDPNVGQDTSKGDLNQEAEDLRIRRSNRRVDSRNNGTSDPYADVHIFEIELTPDGFRPGQRNKKLDTLCCTSQGLVLAGTNTGELFVWKVYFQEIQKQNTFNAQKFLGKFLTPLKCFRSVQNSENRVGSVYGDITQKRLTPDRIDRWLCAPVRFIFA